MENCMKPFEIRSGVFTSDRMNEFELNRKMTFYKIEKEKF